jgi:hypothetical protein
MRPITQSKTVAAGVVGAIAASQTTAGAGNLLINGSLAAGGVATLPTQQVLGITSTGNLSAVNFTITGTDSQGRVIVQTIAGPNVGTVQTTLNYLTVTQIAVSGAVATAVTVDTVGVGATQEIPIDRYQNPTNITLTVEVTGTVNYTVQWTTDDIFGGAPGPFVWFPGPSNLVAASTTQSGTLVSDVIAVRLLINSGTGSAQLRVVQGGVMG